MEDLSQNYHWGRHVALKNNIADSYGSHKLKEEPYMSHTICLSGLYASVVQSSVRNTK